MYIVILQCHVLNKTKRVVMSYRDNKTEKCCSLKLLFRITVSSKQ